MSKKVTIPTDGGNPFVVILGGIKYVYKPGETVDVPDGVALEIEEWERWRDKYRGAVQPPFAAGGGGSSVQPDLSQNDPTAADYVKGRTHWEETENAVVEYSAGDSCRLDGFPTFEIGDTVTINIDGVEHSLVAFNLFDGPAIGDTIDEIMGGTGQFGWQLYVSSDGIAFTSTASHTIAYTKKVVHKLDEKFLPYSVAPVAISGNYADLNGIPEALIDINVEIGTNKSTIIERLEGKVASERPLSIFFMDTKGDKYWFYCPMWVELRADDDYWQINSPIMYSKNSLIMNVPMQRLYIEFDSNGNVTSGSFMRYANELYLSADAMGKAIFKITVDNNGTLTATEVT